MKSIRRAGGRQFRTPCSVAHSVPARRCATDSHLTDRCPQAANIAKSTAQEATWTATLQKFASRAILYLAAIVVPLMLWVSYLYLSFFAITPAADAAIAGPPPPVAPSWLSGVAIFIADHFIACPRLGAIGSLYVWFMLAIAFVCLFIGRNSNSLNQLYRDRLSRAFLFQREALRNNTKSVEDDRWKFSSLKPFDESQGTWSAGAPIRLCSRQRR